MNWIPIGDPMRFQVDGNPHLKISQIFVNYETGKYKEVIFDHE